MTPQNDRLMTHNYDGIEEYDNPMPSWWTAIVVASVVFSLGYFFWYHAGGAGMSVADDYAAQAQELAERRAHDAFAQVGDGDVKAWLADTGLLDRGKAKYAEVCAVCHGALGEGKIGPNLTDGHFLHGASLSDLAKVVADGVAAKGMPTWSRALKPDDLKAVVAFAASLRGRNLPGKEPQGTPHVLGPAAASPTATRAP